MKIYPKKILIDFKDFILDSKSALQNAQTNVIIKQYKKKMFTENLRMAYADIIKY